MVHRSVIITLTCIVCALLEIVDTTIVNVALNDMRGNLGGTLSEMGWVITAYAIGNVIIVPMTSWFPRSLAGVIISLLPSSCLPFFLFYVAMHQVSGSW